MTLQEQLTRVALEHGCGDSLIPKLMPIITADREAYADKRAIEELSKVKLDYGPYQAETFAGGKRQSLPDRIAELNAELEKLNATTS